MTLSFDREGLCERLSALPPIAALAFAAACAARLENTARSMSADEGLNRLLAQSLDAAIAFVSRGLPFDTLAAEQALLAAMPDEDACPDLASAVADDAAAAAVYVLRLIRDGDPRDGMWAAERAYDIADEAVLRDMNVAVVDQAVEARLLRHPVVRTELERQSRDLDSVSRIGAGPAGLTAVIETARRENILLTDR